MKQCMAILLLSLFCVSASNAGVVAIDNECAAIKKALPRFESDTQSFSGYSTQGGKAIAYLDKNKAIRFIHTEAPGETSKEVRDFYFKAGALIYACYEIHTFNAPFYMNAKLAKEEGCDPFDPKKTMVRKERFYFLGDKLIEWIGSNKKPMAKGTKDYEFAEYDRLNFARELIGLFQ
jgi:hypothetical protein